MVCPWRFLTANELMPRSFWAFKLVIIALQKLMASTLGLEAKFF
jgi:hypothetical protein